MASLRKAAPSRTYQERHQPHARERFGLLEKHKDYVLRARDFHKKQDELQRLRVKAALRNPDEFYHHMTRSRTTKSGHQDLSAAATAQPPSDDKYLAYVAFKEGVEKKKIEQLQSSLHFLGPADDAAVAAPEATSEVISKYKELAKRGKRSRALTQLKEKLQVRKNLTKKGKRRLVSKGGENAAPVYKWRKERAK